MYYIDIRWRFQVFTKQLQQEQQEQQQPQQQQKQQQKLNVCLGS